MPIIKKFATVSLVAVVMSAGFMTLSGCEEKAPTGTKSTGPDPVEAQKQKDAMEAFHKSKGAKK